MQIFVFILAFLFSLIVADNTANTEDTKKSELFGGSNFWNPFASRAKQAVDDKNIADAADSARLGGMGGMGGMGGFGSGFGGGYGGLGGGYGMGGRYGSGSPWGY